MYMHIDNETAGFILAHSLKLTSSCISKLCDLAQFNLSDGELSAHTRVWTDRQNSPPKTAPCVTLHADPPFFARPFHPLGLAGVPKISKVKAMCLPKARCPRQRISLLANSSLLVCVLNQLNWNCLSWQVVVFCF